MLNYRTPNMYQPILPQRNYDGQYGCYPSNTPHLNDFQSYNYQQYSHSPSVDSLLMADPIQSQMSYNQRPICMPSNLYQQQQNQQQHLHYHQQENQHQYHLNSMYPDVNGGGTIGGNVASMNSVAMQSMNSSVNGMPINFQNNVPYNNQLEQTMNQNPESDVHNFSDLVGNVGTEELMNVMNDFEQDLNRVTGDLGKLGVVD